jgi:hypothetical protein
MARRALKWIAIACLSAGTVWAADDPFVGKWKLDPDKSKLSDQMKVGAAGANRYTFDFGSGDTETIVVDGTDQPGLFGTTFAVTAVAPDTWTGVRKKDGHVLLTGIWKLSADGKNLTDTFTSYQADGSTRRLDYVYTREEGAGSGFVGTWVSTSEKVNSTYEVEIAPYEGDGLSFILRAQQSTKSLKFDGKDYLVQGPNLPEGYAVSGRRVNDRSLEIADKVGSKTIDRQQVEVSADGKTLTMSVQPAGTNKPNVLVFDRE